MVPRLKAANLREIQTSLYSIVPEIHDAVTGLPGSCEKTKTALEKLNESGIPVFISCPVMKQNKDSYGAVIQWGKARNIRSAPDNMIFARFDRSTDNLTSRLDIDEALRVVKDILKNDPGAYRRERFAPGYNNPDEALPCVQGVCKGSLCVNAAGEALPSPGWHRVLGNLHKQTLRDIWETSAELKRVQSISLDDFLKCQTCPDIQFCGMSLEGNANENPQGNPFIIPAQVCELARRTRELVWAWYESKDTP
jgi:MoaA/NifB/PqqE/SkfB family radical SAM enzyme